MIKLSIKTKRLDFTKSGSRCYLKVNGRFRFILIGRVYLINVFGREFTNK